MQEGAGGEGERERKRERDKHRHQWQGHASPPQNPGYGAGMSRVASGPAPALFPILTLGCPSKEQLQARQGMAPFAQGRVTWKGQLPVAGRGAC